MRERDDAVARGEGGDRSWEQRIALDPAILVGKPIVKGTRLSVEFVVQLLADGWTEQVIVDQYPGLTAEDVRACLQYASERLREDKAYPLTA